MAWLITIVPVSFFIIALLFISQQVADAILAHVYIANSTIDTDKPLMSQFNSNIEYDKSHLSPTEFKQKVQQMGQAFENATYFCNSSAGGLATPKCNELISIVSLVCQGVVAKENIFECSNPAVPSYLKNHGVTEPEIYARYGIERHARESAMQEQQAIEKFQMVFCGLNTKPNSNGFITEYKLPKTCEMPLGIAVDNDKVWYVSTKNGTLGSFDIKQNSFGKEVAIPIWKSRINPIDFSQVWSVKIDGRGSVWLTDEKQNTIWRYIKSSQTFEMFKVPDSSETSGTIYPVSLDFDSKGNVYFVGIRSTSLWFGNVTKMKNGTSLGISGIPMPVDKFAGIDPILISTGSLSVDNKRNAVWISMLVFQNKGQIVRYDINAKTFKVFDTLEQLASPVGTTMDDIGNLWVTNHGSSLFYKLDGFTGNITKFATSKPSPRIFGNSDNTTPEDAYTLPYWIKKSNDGSIWLNEYTGNKIAKFNPANNTLIEYWIPTQNKLFGQCQQQQQPGGISNQTCGIANALQFSPGQDGKMVWFTEWTENKLGRVDAQKQLPFSVSTPTKEVTIDRNQYEHRPVEIKMNIKASSNSKIHMISSGFNPKGGSMT